MTLFRISYSVALKRNKSYEQFSAIQLHGYEAPVVKSMTDKILRNSECAVFIDILPGKLGEQIAFVHKDVAAHLEKVERLLTSKDKEIEYLEATLDMLENGNNAAHVLAAPNDQRGGNNDE